MTQKQLTSDEDGRPTVEMGLRHSRHSASGTGIQHPGIQHPGIAFNIFARRLGVPDETIISQRSTQ